MVKPALPIRWIEQAGHTIKFSADDYMKVRDAIAKGVFVAKDQQLILNALYIVEAIKRGLRE